MPPRLLFVLFACWSIAAAAAPVDAPRLRSADPGVLPNAVVTSLAEDRDGFLWLGTAGGLLRHDGYRFRRVGMPPDAPAAAAALFVRTLHADADGTLWVGSDFAGLLRVDRAVGVLRPVPLGTEAGRALSINALSGRTGAVLWIGSDGDGLFALDAAGVVRRHRAADGSGLPDDRIGALRLDAGGVLWVGSWSGLARLAPGAARFEPVPLEGGAPRIGALHEDAAGRLWIGTQDGRLFRRAPDGAIERLPAAPASGVAPVLAVVDAKDGTTWVGRADGIEVRETAGGALRQALRHDPDRPAGLAGNEVRALLRDRGGQLWVGGFGFGVQRHDPAHAAFVVLDRGTAAGRLLGDPNIRSVAVLRDGRILLGSHDRGIAILAPDLAPLGLLAGPSGEPAFRGTRVLALAEAADGAWWIGSDQGLFRRAPDGAALDAFAVGPGRVRRLLADADGGVWAGTESGLFHKPAAATAFASVATIDGPPLDGDINALARDADGALWIGGDRGLARLDAGASRARWIAAAHPARGGNPDVLGLWADDPAALWFDTPGGLFRLHRAGDRAGAVDAIAHPEGAAVRAFGANLLVDARGRVWSQHAVFDPAAARTVALGPAEGVEIGSAWFRAYARTADGRFLFGGTRGLLVVDPARYELPSYDAPLVVTELRVDDAAQAWDGTSTLRLAPGQRRVTVEFAALDYAAPMQLRYRHRVVGDDDAWHDTDAGYRVATLANLAPGDYRLEVEASDRHGRWTGRRIALPLQVLPAWWQQPAFHAALVLLALAGVQLLVRQRTRWHRERQAELERRVAERTAELAAISAALEEKSAALERASLTDALTGLHNRRYFAAHVDVDVAQCRRRHADARRAGVPARNADLVFFLLDLDHFKRINDELGHDAGDAVLVQMRDRLAACFRDSDHLVRWGGEEFLVVSRDSDRRLAPELAARAVQGVSATPFALPGGRAWRCTASVGYAALPLQPAWPDAHGWKDVVALADAALYAAKHAGRDGWVGIEAVDAAPIDGGDLRALGDLLDAGRLRVEASLPVDAVRGALRGDAGPQGDAADTGRLG